MILIKHPINWGLSENKVETLAVKALKIFGFDENKIELSVYFVGRDKAKKLNIDYRQKNYIPQVLGFPMSKQVDADGMIRLGDIVICTQKLKYESVFLKKNIDIVLEEWLVHGVENLVK
ncbi:MAG: rRNA maturation RNase YbeY [Candidatus Shapirobacteria bacterium]